MDYTSKPMLFKLKKAARYLQLYGVSRTLIKVKAQYHMKRTFTPLPTVVPRIRRTGGSGVGIIGCGNFAYSNIAYYLNRFAKGSIVGCMDLNPHRAASLCLDYGASYFTTDAERIFADPDISLVYVASNHASHAEYAISALRAGKAVHIEKPHVVSLDQLRRLCLAMGESSRPVRLGFNRPDSRFGRILENALLGEDSPRVMNWFIAGHELPADHWYFSEAEGGRVLGNLCHWTDFILRMVPRDKRYPIQIIPTRSDRSDCNIAVTYIFGDGSIGAITFSAMGHTFEGVRERFSIHCGDLLGHLDDFQSFSLERLDSKRHFRNFHRDHGHSTSILGSYRVSAGVGTERKADVEYVWETGELFLRTKEALEADAAVTLSAFDPSKLKG
jgi:predicted dehydrogenase